jgi:hypothetical protein
VVIAFMLTFLVGAAFAAIPGALQVAGGIGVGDPNLLVRWYEILGDREASTLPGALGPVAGFIATNNQPHATTDIARIVNFMTTMGVPHAPPGMRGVDDRLEWAIGFVDEGFVTLDARAINYGTITAELLAPSHFSWADTAVMFSEMFTVTYSVIATTGTATGGTWPVILEPDETVDIRITVTWDGEMPIGGFAADLSPFADPELPQHNWTLDYWLRDLIGGDAVGSNAVGYDWANNFFFNLIYQVAP